MFKYVKEPKLLGTLIVDEAGQAQPYMALGSIFRCKKTIIVGDPKQVEPVVTDYLEILKENFKDKCLEKYKSKTISVQSFADQINSYGTYVNQEWIGCPLLVHRRCLKTMFDISNAISYGGIMKIQTKEPDQEKIDSFLEKDIEAKWLDVKGKEKSEKNHYVEKQGQEICNLLRKNRKHSPNYYPKLFIISPFKSVINELEKKLIKEFNLDEKSDGYKWVNNNLGTVHKFQGKEASEVIFELGCDDKTNNYAITKFVNSNIVNVAVTRAKYRLYVIGDYNVWINNNHIKKSLWNN
ncbi:AAA domain-containing protein [Metamycoplasma hyosynoviae]|uniref:DEAD/DEAH box helicase n=1 Tax=Metamycoplasma hyosynoviae TaxID=29559 RepID=UPI002365659A|nr:AAA domain-containing protein [Metamycoplasma hyosynoviae]MDD7837637.1 AAA domain-containing protein [Metamycoplasma hyosynoviae]